MSQSSNKKVITEETVQYVARLSRLSLDDKEASKFQGQLSNIINYIDQLSEVDTEGTLPMAHVLSSMKDVFREDEPCDSLPNEKALQNAPSKDGNFFKVPKVIKNN